VAIAWCTFRYDQRVDELGERYSGRVSRAWSAWSRSAVKLAHFCAGYFYGAQQRLFDLLLGVSTRGTVATADANFGAGGENCHYQGCGWLSLRRALKDLNPSASDVFVDLGSGKGRALLIAGRLPYKDVVGVEIDQELSRLAARNIDRARRRLRAERVECLTASVLEWPIPDDASVIFMFNPFVGQTFSTVTTRIFESYDRNPRPLHIVYEHPWEHDQLLSTGRVVVNNVRSGTWPGLVRWWKRGDVIVTYRVVDCVAGNKLEWRRPHGVLRPRRAVQRWSAPNGHNFSTPIPGSDKVYTKFSS
jgi:SAM-dependent methyltransferase